MSLFKTSYLSLSNEKLNNTFCIFIPIYIKPHPNRLMKKSIHLKNRIFASNSNIYKRHFILITFIRYKYYLINIIKPIPIPITFHATLHPS